MKFLSLFAGIGGFDLGLERAGMQCVGQVEKDEFCLAVLAHHWPSVKRIADIYDVTESDFGAVDLICGGFPCQPFSTAGKRAGASDDRYLWPEMLRIIKAYRPAWVLGENVAGIISMALDTVHADLAAIGYQVQSFVIPACAVDAPHRRDRVWIVAHGDFGGSQGGVELPQPSYIVNGGEYVADTQGVGSRCGLCKTGQKQNWYQSSDSGQDVPDNGLWSGQGAWASERRRSGSAWWLPEPDVGRVADGIPGRVDRLRSLGNAVVPQVVEEIGRAIMKAEECARKTRGRAGEHHATAAACHE